MIGDLIADVVEDKPNKFRSKFAARRPEANVKEGARSVNSAEDDARLASYGTGPKSAPPKSKL